ncbi:MAG TPA: hypothetical protein PK402_10160, partial [Tepidisphaeraceae bacterium]|nr:hypothetical protein [Tepidisphaeraceae bacterium]
MTHPTHRRRARLNPSVRTTLESLERRVLMCTLDHAADVAHFQGSTDVLEVEPNNTLATATEFTVSESQFAGGLSSSADVDIYKGEIAAGQRITVDVGTDPGQRHYKPRVELLDPAGNVLIASNDGRCISHVVSDSGTYYVRISHASSYGSITGSYGSEGGSNRIRVTMSTFAVVPEISEPNDSTVTWIGNSGVRGSIGSSTDVDKYSFTNNSGAQKLVVKFTNPAVRNPSVRLYNMDNTLIASDLSGMGLIASLPSGGNFTLVLGADNSNGSVTGSYLASVNRYAASSPIISESNATSIFESASLLTVTSSITNAIGTLDNLIDVDTYAVDLLAALVARAQVVRE